MVSFTSGLIALVAYLSLTSAAPTKRSAAGSEQTYTLLFLDSTQSKSYALPYGYEELITSVTKTISFAETVSYVYYDHSLINCTFFSENESKTVTVQDYGSYSTFTKSVSLKEVKCSLIESSSSY